MGIELAFDCVKRAKALYDCPVLVNLERDDEFLSDCNDLFKSYLSCHENISYQNVTFITDFYKKVLTYASLLVMSGSIKKSEVNSLLEFRCINSIFKNNTDSLETDLSLLIDELSD